MREVTIARNIKMMRKSGSAIAYYHPATNRKLIFDGPHPGNELYLYQVKMVVEFLKDIGEIGGTYNGSNDGI